MFGGMFDTCSFCVDLATDARGTENFFGSLPESDPVSPDPMRGAEAGILLNLTLCSTRIFVPTIKLQNKTKRGFQSSEILKL